MCLGTVSNFASLFSITEELAQNVSRLSEVQNSDLMFRQYIEGFHKQQNEGRL